MPSGAEVPLLLRSAGQAHRAGQFARAEALYRRLLAVEPGHPEAWYPAGILQFDLVRAAAAAERIGRAVALNDRVFQWHADRGSILMTLGRIEPAAECCRRALVLCPERAEVHANLGNLAKLQGRAAAAAGFYRRALSADPRLVEAHNNLGTLLQDMGHLAEAETHHRTALALQPDSAVAAANLATGHLKQQRLAEATVAFQGALALRPASADAHCNLAAALHEQGRLEEAIAAYRRATHCDPGHAAAGTGLVFAGLYRPGVTLAGVSVAARAWGASAGAGWNLPGGRGLRLGLVSGDFRHHAVGRLILPAVEALARRGHEIVCYANCPLADGLTGRFRRAASGWREIFGMTDRAVAERIAEDGIDCLFDLSGYSQFNRIGLFAGRAAPLQVAWIGYPATTGLAAMDYILADPVQLPDGAEPFYREKPIRLPHGYACFAPPEEAPAVGALPALRRGHVTFGSFNTAKKITPATVAVWSALLRRLPSARLVLKAPAFACEATAERYRALFAGQGIGGERLTFLGGTPLPAHLAAMAGVDVALDSFPYSGGQTSLDCLWMGLPVVTWPGETLASRHTLGYLSAIGLAGLAASDAEGYVTRAAGLAADLPGLSALRDGLRERMLAAPLCDAERFAGHLELALDALRRRHRAGLPPAALIIPPEGPARFDP